MKLIAEGNGHTYTVNYIEFEKDGTIKHIKGLFGWCGMEDHPIGAHRDFVNLDKEVKLKVIYDS